MAFRNILISLILVGLFLTAMVNFGVGIVGLNEGNNQSIGDDPRISKLITNLSTAQSGLDESTNAQLGNFEQENPVDSFGELIFFTITKAGTTFTGVIKTFWAISGGLIFDVIFGGSPAFAVVFSMLGTILLVTIIFLLWRTYKAGE